MPLRQTPAAQHDVILERPHTNLSGVRKIPQLVHANGIPILRYKKPQPGILSCMIQHKITTRQTRHDQKERMSELIELGIGENEWDQVVAAGLGRWDEEALGPRGISWSSWPVQINHEVNLRLVAEAKKNVARTKKYMEIIDREIALKREEDRVRANKKRGEQRKQARARRAEQASSSTVDVSKTKAAGTSA